MTKVFDLLERLVSAVEDYVSYHTVRKATVVAPTPEAPIVEEMPRPRELPKVPDILPIPEFTTPKIASHEGTCPACAVDYGAGTPIRGYLGEGRKYRMWLHAACYDERVKTNG